MSKILVIEDEDDLRAVVQAMLKTEGFEVLTAPDGKIGLSMATEHHPDLILCDIMMPGMNGYQVFERLKEDPATGAIPFVFVTALSGSGEVRQGMNLGADDYLAKPFRKMELVGMVKARLARNAVTTRLFQDKIKKFEEKLTNLENYDPLTGLPNRWQLMEYFGTLSGETDGQIAVILIDIDRLTRINDTLGLKVGDAAIKEVAQRLQQKLGELPLFRLQGDEFLVLVNGRTDNQEQVVQTVMSVFAHPFEVEGQEFFITASVGISHDFIRRVEIDSLIQRSMEAVHEVKVHGGNGHAAYRRNEESHKTRHLTLEAEMRHALDRNEFEVFYQARVEAFSRRVKGAEALVRWNHPRLGRVSPGEFIPIAEENGLVVPLGELVLETTCLQLKKWLDDGLTGFRMAINLSARQFNEPNLSKKIIDIIHSTGVSPSSLELEVTESALVQKSAPVKEFLTELRQTGISITLDDFGTGFSSLSYLSRFPFDVIKVDQSFVRSLDTSKVNKAISNAIIRLSHDLDLYVVAEGVETEAEYHYLMRQGCDEMQGYYFHRPEPAALFEKTLKLKNYTF